MRPPSLQRNGQPLKQELCLTWFLCNPCYSYTQLGDKLQCQLVYYYYYYYQENLLHEQCQCFMIESEAWNVSLNLSKNDSEEVSFQISLKGVEGR